MPTSHVNKASPQRSSVRSSLELRDLAESSLRNSFAETESTVADVGKTEVFVQPGGSDCGNGHWYKFEVASTAREAGKFGNFSENHYFIKACIRAGRERLVFVISFHHVGRDLTGIMEATSFSRLESYKDSDDANRLTGVSRSDQSNHSCSLTRRQR
jgi:hypothetical protein